MVLIGFMIGALPKIWPWQKPVAWEVISASKKLQSKPNTQHPGISTETLNFLLLW